MKERYVVQVYRRDRADPDHLSGTVERIGNGQARSFNSMSELWAFLVKPGARRRTAAGDASDTPADKSPPTDRRKP
jgi:hypothetical protein